MNQEPTNVEREEALPETGEYVVHRSRLADVIAILVCILLAFVVWIIVMNVTDTDHLALEVLSPREGYEYTLSAPDLAVKGAVVDLKRAGRIGVRVPDHMPAVYTLTEADLELPAGVTLAEPLRLTLTVRRGAS